MSWYSIPRLGPSGGEVDLNCRVMDVNVQEGNIQLEQRNLAGGMVRSYLRQNVPMVTLMLAMIPDSLMAILRGFQASMSPLNFIFNKTLTMRYLMATSASTTSIVIPLTSATGITITGVFLQSDTAQSGTNYFSGGSTFSATTGTITLATPLPGANTDVWVNYTFTGLSCWVKVNIRPHQGQYASYWQGNLELTGA